VPLSLNVSGQEADFLINPVNSSNVITMHIQHEGSASLLSVSGQWINKGGRFSRKEGPISQPKQ